MKDEGLTDEQMGIKPAEDPGLTDEEMGAGEEGPSATQTFALNAGGSLAGGLGVDKALAVGETAGETLANLVTDKHGNFKLGGDGSDPRSILERYRAKVKAAEPIRKGMEKAGDEHPIAALAGQMAPALIPGGASLKGAMVLGGVHGATGGSADTTGGDIKGTALDVAAGAGGAAVGHALGSAGGKFMSWLGKKAGTKLESGIVERSRSLLGKYGQKKRDAVAAMKNLNIQDALERAPKVANSQASPAGRQLNRLKSRFPNAEADLYDASQGNAGKQVRRFVGSQKRFNDPGGMPSVDYARKVALRNMTSQKMDAIKNLLGMSVRVGVGAGVGSAIGGAVADDSNTGRKYGMAVGGAGGLYVARKLALNVMEHPKMLAAMSSKLPGLGRKLSSAGGNTGAVTGYLTALFSTKQGRRVLEESLSDAEMNVEPQAADYDDSDFTPDGELTTAAKRKRFKPIPSENVMRYREAPTGGDL